MASALLIRLRPRGPWRFGPGDGGLDRVDWLFRSDRLFSALTLAMKRLGLLDPWLEATATAPVPAVVLSSLFPFGGDTLFVIPPATLWPPPAALVSAPSQVFLSKIRWNAAHFVPLPVVDALASGTGILADQWLVDAESGCLLRRDRPSTSPFRMAARVTAAIDRLDSGTALTSSSVCVEFEAAAGLWGLARYRDDEAEKAWNDPLQAAFRLLADSGFGARRSSGWGQSESPEFQSVSWPALLLPKVARQCNDKAVGSAGHWLLSLYSPAASDAVDWTGGQYEALLRSGFVEGNGNGHAKKSLRMIAEGSVLESPQPPVGAAVDVAPDGFPHPVYRSGLAFALELPLLPAKEETAPVEAPTTEEAVIEPPCAEEESADSEAIEETSAPAPPEPDEPKGEEEASFEI